MPSESLAIVFCECWFVQLPFCSWINAFHIRLYVRLTPFFGKGVSCESGNGCWNGVGVELLIDLIMILDWWWLVQRTTENVMGFMCICVQCEINKHTPTNHLFLRTKCDEQNAKYRTTDTRLNRLFVLAVSPRLWQPKRIASCSQQPNHRQMCL